MNIFIKNDYSPYDVIKFKDTDITVKQLVKIYILIDSIKKLDKIDGLLFRLPYENFPYEIPLAILRYTFSYRRRLTHWDLLLCQLKFWLEVNNKDTNKILLGLL